MSEVSEAVAKIDAIWGHVVRAERFRGYRPLTVAGTGVLGLSVALVQPSIVPLPLADPDLYLGTWVVVATASCLLVGLELLAGYLRTNSYVERTLTHQALRQFVPCLIAGALLTGIIRQHHPDSVPLLPGLWAVCFSLGIFASVPFMPPTVRWVAWYYLAAGILCLASNREGQTLHPWMMGGTFGIGQILMAGTLLLAEERRHESA